jgi:hypothetical protein
VEPRDDGRAVLKGLGDGMRNSAGKILAVFVLVLIAVGVIHFFRQSNRNSLLVHSKAPRKLRGAFFGLHPPG